MGALKWSFNEFLAFLLIYVANVDMEFAEELCTVHKVAAIPLSPFYRKGSNEKILRFCFAKQDETLKQAAAILCKI